jgi:RNA polymerase sigma-70 factor (ECF subfamily)
MTGSELVTRLAGGDRAALGTLYERHWQAVYRFAWMLANSVADAEDITQDCFLVLTRQASRFDASRCRLRTWLISIARNLYLRRSRSVTQPARTIPAVDESPPEREAEQELIRIERANAVQRALAAVPVAQREALFLFEFEGLSLLETAEISRD